MEKAVFIRKSGLKRGCTRHRIRPWQSQALSQFSKKRCGDTISLGFLAMTQILIYFFPFFGYSILILNTMHKNAVMYLTTFFFFFYISKVRPISEHDTRLYSTNLLQIFYYYYYYLFRFMHRDINMKSSWQMRIFSFFVIYSAALCTVWAVMITIMADRDCIVDMTETGY